ncbi:hypothetical protein MD484_g7101, partial [Candolleomyces efflorescens]
MDVDSVPDIRVHSASPPRRGGMRSVKGKERAVEHEWEEGGVGKHVSFADSTQDRVHRYLPYAPLRAEYERGPPPDPPDYLPQHQHPHQYRSRHHEWSVDPWAWSRYQGYYPPAPPHLRSQPQSESESQYSTQKFQLRPAPPFPPHPYYYAGPHYPNPHPYPDSDSESEEGQGDGEGGQGREQEEEKMPPKMRKRWIRGAVGRLREEEERERERERETERVKEQEKEREREREREKEREREEEKEREMQVDSESVPGLVLGSTTTTTTGEVESSTLPATSGTPINVGESSKTEGEGESEVASPPPTELRPPTIPSSLQQPTSPSPATSFAQLSLGSIPLQLPAESPEATLPSSGVEDTATATSASVAVVPRSPLGLDESGDEHEQAEKDEEDEGEDGDEGASPGLMYPPSPILDEGEVRQGSPPSSVKELSQEPEPQPAPEPEPERPAAKVDGEEEEEDKGLEEGETSEREMDVDVDVLVQTRVDDADDGDVEEGEVSEGEQVRDEDEGLLVVSSAPAAGGGVDSTASTPRIGGRLKELAPSENGMVVVEGGEKDGQSAVEEKEVGDEDERMEEDVARTSPVEEKGEVEVDEKHEEEKAREGSSPQQHPPTKVKMSLKDFALRKKKQKEEESKKAAEMGVVSPTIPASVPGLAPATVPSIVTASVPVATTPSPTSPPISAPAKTISSPTVPVAPSKPDPPVTATPTKSIHAPTIPLPAKPTWPMEDWNAPSSKPSAPAEREIKREQVESGMMLNATSMQRRGQGDVVIPPGLSSSPRWSPTSSTPIAVDGAVEDDLVSLGESDDEYQQQQHSARKTSPAVKRGIPDGPRYHAPQSSSYSRAASAVSSARALPQDQEWQGYPKGADRLETGPVNAYPAASTAFICFVNVFIPPAPTVFVCFVNVFLPPAPSDFGFVCRFDYFNCFGAWDRTRPRVKFTSIDSRGEKVVDAYSDWPTATKYGLCVVNDFHGDICCQHEHVGSLTILPLGDGTTSAFKESTSVTAEYATVLTASTAVDDLWTW